MDNKVKNYIDYIVNDTINNTQFDMEKKKISFPFDLVSYGRNSNQHHWLYMKLTPEKFKKYVMEKYGVREDEIGVVWKTYSIRVLYKFLRELE
jgi:hypothetical protein